MPLGKLLLGKSHISALCIATCFAAPLLANAQGYDGPRITFEQIYAQPDNQELNLNYARQQAAEGDYISAAGTLERLLFAEPDWDSARLFYALVLFKLDDQFGAQRQLKLLDARPLSAAQKKQVSIYRGEYGETTSSGNNSEASFSGRAVIGVRWDDNAGNALADNLLTVTNQDDFSAFAQGSINFSAPINEAGMRFRAGLNGQTLRHDQFSASDYDTIAGHAGISGKTGNMKWALDGQMLKVFISGSDYLTQIGPRLSVSTKIAPNTRISLSGSYYDQDYRDLAFTVGEIARSGDKYTILASIRQKLSDRSYIGAAIGYDHKAAANPGFAYDGWKASVNFGNKFANGVYIKGRAKYRMLSYNPFAIGAIERDDDHISGRLSLGTGLSAMGLDNTSIEAGVSYVDRSSNIAGLDYKNVGVELKLIFDF